MIAENGQMAIHLPLTTGRISAFSTHTAHPEFVYCMNQILKNVLCFNMNIINPFLYKTKAEVVSILKNDFNTIEHTVSCWKSARMTGHSYHCGECIPCLIRRIANEFNGIILDEFNRDLLSEVITNLDENDSGRRNLLELAEFVRFFETTVSEAEITEQYPELLNECIDAKRAIEMHRRFAKQARTVFNNYKNLTSVVS